VDLRPRRSEAAGKSMTVGKRPRGERRPGKNRRPARPSAGARRARNPRAARRRALLVAVLAAALAGGLVAGAYFTPVLAVRSIKVETQPSVPEAEIRALVEIPEGTPLLQVDTAEVAGRLAALPKVASVRVQRQFPSTLRVVVAERVAIAFYDAPGGPHLLDKEGATFAVEPPPPGVPRIEVENPAPGDAATAAAIEVLQSLGSELDEQVQEIKAPSPEDISLVLADGRRVVWGGTGDSERKSRVLEVLLTESGDVYDVSSPELPTIR
jgi:cell division protein FtsQ